MLWPVYSKEFYITREAMLTAAKWNDMYKKHRKLTQRPAIYPRSHFAIEIVGLILDWAHTNTDNRLDLRYNSKSGFSEFSWASLGRILTSKMFPSATYKYNLSMQWLVKFEKKGTKLRDMLKAEDLLNSLYTMYAIITHYTKPILSQKKKVVVAMWSSMVH